MNPWNQSAEQHYAQMAPGQVNWADLAAQWINQGAGPMAPQMPQPPNATGFGMLPPQHQLPPPPPPQQQYHDYGMLHPQQPPMYPQHQQHQQQWQQPQLQPPSQPLVQQFNGNPSDFYKSSPNRYSIPPHDPGFRQRFDQPRNVSLDMMAQRFSAPFRQPNGGGFAPQQQQQHHHEEWNHYDQGGPVPLNNVRTGPPQGWEPEPQRATAQPMAPMFASGAHPDPDYDDYGHHQQSPRQRPRSRESPPRRQHHEPPRQLKHNIQNVAPMPSMESMGAEQRKSLPAWIREGLEQAEREKAQKRAEEEELESGARRALTPPTENRNGKGRFDSDSEEELEPATTSSTNGSRVLSMSPTSDHDDECLMRPSPPPSPDSFKEIAAGVLRDWMTSILLQTCDSLVDVICSDVHEEAVRTDVIQSARGPLVAFSSDSDDSDVEVKTEKKSAEFKMPAVPPPMRAKAKLSISVDNGASSSTEVKNDLRESRKEKPVEKSRERSSDSRRESKSHKHRRSRSRSPKKSERSKSPKKRDRSRSPSRRDRPERSRSPSKKSKRRSRSPRRR